MRNGSECQFAKSYMGQPIQTNLTGFGSWLLWSSGDGNGYTKGWAGEGLQADVLGESIVQDWTLVYEERGVVGEKDRTVAV